MKQLDARFYLDTTTAHLLPDNSRDWQDYADNVSRFAAPDSYWDSLAANFTSKKNIQRLIEHLFLGELREEYKSMRKNDNKLTAFQGKLLSNVNYQHSL